MEGWYLSLHKFSFFFGVVRGRRDRMIVGLQLPMQSVLITTNVVSLNPT